MSYTSLSPYTKTFESTSKMLQSCTQTTTFHKVKAHTNTNGNEQAYTLSKLGCELDHIDAVATCEHAHPTP